MLEKNEFLVLTEIERKLEKYTQRRLSEKTGLSVGLVNKVIKELVKKELIVNMAVTKKGYEALEPYRVKRAIFIAAGFGSRMVPLTFNTPKPLIRVNGKRMIDTLLDAVVAVGIEEIYIVRGYLGEQFDVLRNKYPNINFIENPTYSEANNIGSALKCKDLIRNSYVCEADLVLSNPNIITKYQYQSNYLGIYKEVSDDWCFITDNNKRITGLAVGAEKKYQMVGISYYTEDDGIRLSKDIEKVYNMPGGKERYWDQVALQYCVDNYNVYVRECKQEDIIEIDSFKELKEIDKTYDI